MICNKCGFKVEKGAKFCTNCGNKLDNNQEIEQQTYHNPNENQVTSKKRFNKNIIILILAFIVIIILYKLYLYNNNPEKMYKDKISQYLQEKYNEEFDINFLYKGIKTSEIWDGVYVKCSACSDRIAYIYSFSPKDNNNIKCYIAYYNIYKEKTEGIEEISDLARYASKSDNFFVYSENVDKYEAFITYNNPKQEIIGKLEMYLGNDYEINLYSNAKKIIAKTNQSYKDIMQTAQFNELYNNIIKLINDKDIEILLKFNDVDLLINKYYADYLSEKQDVKDSLEDCLGNNYKIDLYSDIRVIVAETDILYENAKIDNFLENIVNLFKNKNINLLIKYPNKSIKINAETIQYYESY